MTVYAQGADYSHARPPLETLRRHNLSFVCRYLLDDARNKGKALKLTEAQQLSAGGMDIVANFEYATQPVLTSAQGAADARTSLRELEALGAPRRVVYFSFDYDVPASHFVGCLAYLRGAESVLGKGNAGAYGHYRLISYLAGQGIRWLWQTYAWSAGMWSPAATVRQVRNGAFPGEFDGDLNYAMAADIGAWNLEGDDMFTDEDRAVLRNVQGRVAEVYPIKGFVDTLEPELAAVRSTLAEQGNALATMTGALAELKAMVRDIQVAGGSADAVVDELRDRLTE